MQDSAVGWCPWTCIKGASLLVCFVEAGLKEVFQVRARHLSALLQVSVSPVTVTWH